MALYPVGTIFSDSAFQDAVAQAAAKEQLAQNRAGEDWTTQQYNYGLGTGTANPYGQEQVLNRNQAIAGTDAMNQVASRPGGVRSGAYRVRNNNLVFGQGQAQDALLRSFQQAQLANQRQNEDITNTYNSDLYNAGLGSVQRKLDADTAAAQQADLDKQTAAIVAAPAPPAAPRSLGTGKPIGYSKNTNIKQGIKPIKGTLGRLKK